MRLFFSYLSLTLLLLAVAWPAAAGTDQGQPVRIESDRMESGAEPNSIVFSGRVVARQDELVVHSDVMTIFYLSDEEKAALPPDQPRRMKKLFAESNVRIETEEWIGTSDFMEYFELERKVVLIGNAKGWQDNNLVTGKTITMYLDEGHSVVERGETPEERVRAYFYSGDEPAAETEPAETP